MSRGEPGEMVWVDAATLDGGLREAICDVLPPGATFGFNYQGTRAWVRGYGVDTHDLIAAARKRLENG